MTSKIIRLVLNTPQIKYLKKIKLAHTHFKLPFALLEKSVQLCFSFSISIESEILTSILSINTLFKPSVALLL